MAEENNTRSFSYDIPTYYNGAEYPSRVTTVEDSNGIVQNRKVFADSKGRYYEGSLIPIFKRDDFTNPDIRYQNTTGLQDFGNTWSVEDAQLSADYTKYFFENDVLPRLMLSRPWLKGTRYTKNSPFLGKFTIESLPSESARGMTTSAIRYDINGNPFVTSMNKRDLSSLQDKVNALIHESREDMINFHKGIYSNQSDQEAYQYIAKLSKAYVEGDEVTIQKMLPQYDEMRQRVEKARGLAYLTDEEKNTIESAYKTPANQRLEDSGNLNEKVSENTRFRSEISRKHGGVVGNELNRVIDNMSDNEILDVLSSGDSYGQDYRKYIEDNPNEKKQMIKNIKAAMKLVGSFTGGLVTTGTVIKPSGKSDFSSLITK